MAQIVLAETASAGIATPSAAKVALYVDNTAAPQVKFKDDSAADIQLVDTRNTATLSAKTFVAPVLGAATGTSLQVTSTILSTGGGIGYTTGAGGAVTQATSKATAFTLSKLTGTIQFAADALASQTSVNSTWTNTFIGATDLIVFTQISGGTLGGYNMACLPAAGSATVTLRNITSGSLSEAPVFRYAIIKSVIA
jgi:hypothetical protein